MCVYVPFIKNQSHYGGIKHIPIPTGNGGRGREKVKERERESPSAFKPFGCGGLMGQDLDLHFQDSQQ